MPEQKAPNILLEKIKLERVADLHEAVTESSKAWFAEEMIPMTRGKVLSRARQWRLDYQAKVGRAISIREVAEQIGEDRRAVMRIENNDVQRADMDVLTKLSAFYHQAGVDTRVVLEYDPDAKRTPMSAPALQAG